MRSLFFWSELLSLLFMTWVLTLSFPHENVKKNNLRFFFFMNETEWTLFFTTFHVWKWDEKFQEIFPLVKLSFLFSTFFFLISKRVKFFQLKTKSKKLFLTGYVFFRMWIWIKTFFFFFSGEKRFFFRSVKLNWTFSSDNIYFQENFLSKRFFFMTESESSFFSGEKKKRSSVKSFLREFLNPSEFFFYLGVKQKMCVNMCETYIYIFFCWKLSKEESEKKKK